jgi:hypothetical protein
MDENIKELYRLILKHNWTVERINTRPIYNHSRLNMAYEIDLVSPNKMVDVDITIYSTQIETTVNIP